jgi:hypothetical protein
MELGFIPETNEAEALIMFEPLIVEDVGKEPDGTPSTIPVAEGLLFISVSTVSVGEEDPVVALAKTSF